MNAYEISITIIYIIIIIFYWVTYLYGYIWVVKFNPFNQRLSNNTVTNNTYFQIHKMIFHPTIDVKFVVKNVVKSSSHVGMLSEIHRINELVGCNLFCLSTPIILFMSILLIFK